MWIVKLGGSLASSPLLEDWVRLLAEHGAGRVVIVPGGGPFADLVREAQARWRFDEGTAHRMALLAMDQYGLLLAALAPELAAAASNEEIYRALKNARVPVWLPSHSLEKEPAIAQGWEVTSDSLAAWLAAQLNAERLVLLKSCALPPGAADAEKLARLGIVDAAFPEYMRGACFELSVLGKEDAEAMRALLHAGRPCAAITRSS